jgi:hypothetical protein
MQVKPRMSGQPTLHLWMFVRGVVVDDQVQIEFGRRLGVDFLEKLQPLLMTMPRHALGDQAAFGQLDRSKQRRRTVTLVVMRHGAATPRS